MQRKANKNLRIQNYIYVNQFHMISINAKPQHVNHANDYSSYFHNLVTQELQVQVSGAKNNVEGNNVGGAQRVRQYL